MALKHNMNHSQILDAVFDYDNNAIKVAPQDTVHTLNLSASSDSVIAVVPFNTIAQGITQDSRVYRTAAIFSTGAYTLTAAPNINGTMVTIASGASSVNMVIVPICCAQIKLTAPAGSYLVLQG